MSFRAFLCGITRNLALKKLEWRQAAKRRCPGTVSLEELENLLPDERFAPDASGEKIGACINAFLAQEPKEAAVASLTPRTCEVSRLVFARIP